jgi:hypothetical protein
MAGDKEMADHTLDSVPARQQTAAVNVMFAGRNGTNDL